MALNLKSSEPRPFSLSAKIINGGVAGIVGVTCTFPIDLVKTRLQKQRNAPDGSHHYHGMFDCFKKTFSEGYSHGTTNLSRSLFGMKCLYQGYAVNVSFITAEKAIKLSVNDILRHYLVTRDGTLTLSREVIAGGGAGLCQTVVTTPMEFLKIQLQDAGRAQKKKTVATATGGGAVTAAAEGVAAAAALHHKPTIGKILVDRGPIGFLQTIYKGFFATVLRDVPFSMVYFPMFALLNKKGPRKHGSPEAVWYWSLLSGISAGATAAVFVNPFDVVKTRIQILHPVDGERVYSGIMDAFSSVLREEGWRAFFKGAKARMIVIAPLFGIAQAVYFIGVGESIIKRIS